MPHRADRVPLWKSGLRTRGFAAYSFPEVDGSRSFHIGSLICLSNFTNARYHLFPLTQQDCSDELSGVLREAGLIAGQLGVSSNGDPVLQITENRTGSAPLPAGLCIHPWRALRLHVLSQGPVCMIKGGRRDGGRGQKGFPCWAPGYG